MGAGSIETERLLLRPITIDDVALLVELDADPEVMRYIGGRPTPRVDVEATVQRSLGHRWIALELETGAFVGWFSLRPSAERERELGYRLRRAAWGKGYATEGGRALVDLAFRELGADRVWAETMTVNTGSRRVLERCGLRYVRTFFQDWPERLAGSDEGDVEYELRREDWAAASS